MPAQLPLSTLGRGGFGFAVWSTRPPQFCQAKPRTSQSRQATVVSTSGAGSGGSVFKSPWHRGCLSVSDSANDRRRRRLPAAVLLNQTFEARGIRVAMNFRNGNIIPKWLDHEGTRIKTQTKSEQTWAAQRIRKQA